MEASDGAMAGAQTKNERGQARRAGVESVGGCERGSPEARGTTRCEGAADR